MRRNKIVPENRVVIEDKLLASLNEEGKAAILYEKDDLDLLIRGLKIASDARTEDRQDFLTLMMDVQELREATFGK